MNAPRRKRPQGRPGDRSSAPKPVDIWRPVPPLADPEPIEPASDPLALLRSLGDPPMQGSSVLAGHYVGAVVERAAALATALAASAGLLASPR